MFTGLVESTGRVAEVARRAGAARVGIDGPWPTGALADGESVAVDGVCLTVSAFRGPRFWADVVAETLGRTTLGSLRTGRTVNLERSLRVGDRLGGHLVAGHVDGTARVADVRRRGGDCRLRVETPDALAPYVAFKGSVALSGVSLTVAAVGDGWFEVALIPETLRRTTLGRVRRGDRLNVEADLLARYVEGLVRGGAAAGRSGTGGS